MLTPKKILVFSHELPPQGGGAGVVGLQYCHELVQRGFEVTLLTKRKLTYPNSLHNVEIIGASYIPKLYLLPYYFKLKSIDLNQYSHIILNDMVSVYVAGFCFSKDELSKCISVLHGSEPEIIYQSPDFYQQITGLKYFYNKALVGVRKIIAVSDYMKNKFLEETSFNEADKIYIHYSKLGLDFFPVKIDVSHLKNTAAEDVILTVSRIEKGKGFIEMYRIFKKLVGLKLPCKWLIIGDGSFRAEFEALVKSEEMQQHIEFIGQVSRSRLKGYYVFADVFWLLSEYKESFGLVYLEAQACLCPAIGYNKYGVKEAINPGKTGFLVNNAEDCVEIFLQQQYKTLDSDDFISFLNLRHNSTIIDILND